MRFISALGLMTLALNIPICAEQNHQDKDRTTSSGQVMTFPPLLFTAQAVTTKPNANVISSGMVAKVPQFFPVATTTRPNANAVSRAVKVPQLVFNSGSTLAKRPGYDAKVSSGFVIELPNFVPPTAPR
jgi:hypothetical protein